MEPIITVACSVILAIIGAAVITGRYKEKIENLERSKAVIWEEINLLKTSNTTLAQSIVEIKTTLNHVEKGIVELNSGNSAEFNKIATLVTELGEKLNDKYIKKEDMHLWVKKDK